MLTLLANLIFWSLLCGVLGAILLFGPGSYRFFRDQRRGRRNQTHRPELESEADRQRRVKREIDDWAEREAARKRQDV